MHLVWALIGSPAYLGAVINAAGVLEIGVVFPRNGQTYAPTERFPIVFALQNPELGTPLNPQIDSFIRNGSNSNSTFAHDSQKPTTTNFSSAPYFLYGWAKIDTEGPYELFASAMWASCDESGKKVRVGGNTTNFSVRFSIKDDGQKADLVTGTSDDETCQGKVGVALNVTDQTREVPASWPDAGGNCTVLASPSFTLTENPCRVKIDESVVESMEAADHELRCQPLSSLNPPADCPRTDGAVQKLAVAGTASFAAALGAVAFLLA